MNVEIKCYKTPYLTTGVPVQIPGFEICEFVAFNPPTKDGTVSDKWLVAEVATGLPVVKRESDNMESAIDAATFELIRHGLPALKKAVQWKEHSTKKCSV